MVHTGYSTLFLIHDRESCSHWSFYHHVPGVKFANCNFPLLQRIELSMKYSKTNNGLFRVTSRYELPSVFEPCYSRINPFQHQTIDPLHNTQRAHMTESRLHIGLIIITCQVLNLLIVIFPCSKELNYV